MSKNKSTYLGDGVYATLEPRQIKLDTPGQPNNYNVIYLDDEVIKNLINYINNLKTNKQ